MTSAPSAPNTAPPSPPPPHTTGAFLTKDGLAVTSISWTERLRLFTQLDADFGLTPLQMVEAGAFSLAMVVRFALGLSAEGGASIAVIQDSLAGAIAVAGVRHLTNSGAQSAIFIVSDQVNSDTIINAPTSTNPGENKFDDHHKALNTLSPLLRQQLAPLIRSGLEIHFLSPTLPPHSLHELLPLAHNVIVGFGGLETSHPTDTSKMGFLIEALNDAMTPIHCIDYPPGIDPITGKASANTIFASSTLSLGLPLSGLSKSADYIGRHYLCDISIPPLLLAEHGIDLPFIFADQPVKQIFPSNHDAATPTTVTLEGLAAEAQQSLKQERGE
jgi:hypothetical protein